MTLRRISVCSVALAAMISVPALAKQGKVGLWNVTSTTEMALPPEAAAAMKKAGIPASRPITVQMCMSQAEVDSSKPPHIDQGGTGCTTRVLSQTPSSMTSEMTCNGRMKGTGRMQISYRGAEHYQGSYDFKGTVEGNPTSMSTSFRGDWVKADCGAVKPYSLRTQ